MSRERKHPYWAAQARLWTDGSKGPAGQKPLHLQSVYFALLRPFSALHGSGSFLLYSIPFRNVQALVTIAPSYFATTLPCRPFPNARTSKLGTLVNTGSFRQSSTSRSVYIAL